jgi:hypothetical protein
MHTTSLSRAETRSISIAAAPGVVVAFLADGRHLPDWAPNFATQVARDGENWRIGSGDAAFTVTISVSTEHGTVDLLREINDRQGAFMRVVPNFDGCELVFTLVFPDGIESAVVDAQMAVVESELRTVRELCEGL